MNARLRAFLLIAAVLGLAAAGLWARRASRLAAPVPGGAALDTTSAGYRTFREPVMGTWIQVQVPAGPRAAEEAGAVFAVFHEVDARMSEWKDTSPLSAVNREAGKGAVPVPADLRTVLRRGKEIGDLTGGAFDVTWAALWGLWNFKAENPVVPDSAEVARRAALVDYRKVEIDSVAGTVRLPAVGMKIGLGGIAKGYALDRAADTLRAHGVASYLVLGGGQVLAGGTKDGRPWRVGIRDPRGAPDDFFAFLPVENASVSTSGDYESYFVRDGIRYHHILDPRTGWPARGLRSATVMSTDATLADALSTAMMVMGKDRSLALARRLPGVEAVLVDDHGRVSVTRGLEGKLFPVHPPAAGPE